MATEMESTLGGQWLVSDQNESLQKGSKKRRISKHKKKAWRVTSDISDVERYLESERLEERLGAPFAERESQSLFVIDTAQDGDTNEEPKKARSKKDLKNQSLKCFSILTPSSAVQDPIKKRNRVRLPAERKDPLVTKIQQERRALGKIPKRLAQSIADRKKDKERRENKEPAQKLRSKFDFDLWGKEGDSVLKQDNDILEADLDPELKTYHLGKTGKRVYHVPFTMKTKTTALKAVEAPHPGMSYNPTFEDHQELLQKAYNAEMKKVEVEEKISRKVKPMMRKLTHAESQEAWMSEMSQGLAEEDDEVSKPADGDNGEAAVPAKLTERKTKQQRRKEKVAKMLEMKRKKEKADRIMQSDVFRLRSIQRDIAEAEKGIQARQDVRKQTKALREFQPKVLGRLKYEEPLPEMMFSDEITGSLRTSKVEGNLLIDRFKSMQKRNILEPRVKQKVKRKYILKSYTKRSYKQKPPQMTV